ncbi:MAG: hypothetical protein ISR76_01275 [Planctomycetes bacterium]|nr:hypothetical protein [Planctomycetota bacterium]MBL7007600.1 hypothetical protein [Planctomycetota bacterium]
MKTADFLPDSAFLGHLDRRRTPLRLVILGGVALLCLLVSGAFAVEALRVEGHATQAEQPDDAALAARADLEQIYAEMNQYARQIDPLSEHLKRPTVGWILKDIATRVGDGVQIEEVSWDFRFGVPGARDGADRDEVALTLVARVRGKNALLELDDRLQEFTGFERVVPRRQEIVRGREDEIRFELSLEDTLAPRRALPGAKR